MQWETVIGLEIHAQLATKSKIFSGAATAYGAEPNTQACAVDLGLPGVLPVLNQEAVRMAVKFGLAIGASITPRSVFARKNYFYPDLPKGYQISQYDLPVVGNGKLTIEVDGVEKVIGVTRAHLEEDAGKSLQETRLYDANKDETRSMRSKEEANDYRYFPDPDLLPLEITSAAIEAIRTELPELPDEKKARFANDYGLSEYDAGVLTATRELASYFETVVAISACDAKLCANWVMGDLAAALNKAGLEIDASPVEAERLAGLLQRIADDTISGKIAKQVFEALWESRASADDIIDQQGLRQITDTGAIEGIIDEILASNPEQVEGYRGGKDKLFGFFVGQAMKATGGKANPGQLNALLKKKLNG